MPDIYEDAPADVASPPSDDPIAAVLEAFAALRTANATAVVRIARGFGVTPTEFRAAYAVAVGAATTPGQVGRQLGLTTGATTNLIDRVEQAGLLRRTPNPDDRRSVRLHPTDAGLRATTEAQGLWRGAFARAVAVPDAPALAATLRRMAVETDAIGT